MDVKQIVSSKSNEDIIRQLDVIDTKWEFDVNTKTISDHSKTCFGVSEVMNQDDMNDRITNYISYLIVLAKELHARKLFNVRENTEIVVKFNKIMEKVHYSRNIIMNEFHFKKTTKDTYDYNMNTDASLIRFTPLVIDDMKPFQKMLWFLLDRFSELGYKRKGEFCYEQIKTPGGYNTRAWSKKDSIINLVHKVCSITSDHSLFLLLTSSKDMDKQINDFMIRTLDSRFVDLVCDRHVFSFKNGVYYAKYLQETTNRYTDLFVEYDSDVIIPDHVVSCKYFDMDFEYKNETDISKIKTPALDSIYAYQELPEDVIEWNMIFLGRMLYDVGDMDNWQVIMFLLGQAQTGKSTLNLLVKSFYETWCVGVMSNNYQRMFGLSDIYDKFIFIAPEIKRDWSIEQGEFQEIVSGGTVNINVKHKQSVTVDWKAPGMLGGNETPGFIDNAGSIQRRIMVTRFDKKVIKGDPNLQKKLHLEIHAILKKANMMYLKATFDVGKVDIWSVLPEYFLQTQKLMAGATNSLINFLDGDKLQFDPSYSCPLEYFKRLFNIHCTENNFLRPKINVDFYRGPFSKYNIEVREKYTGHYKGQVFKKCTFLFGVDIRTDDDDDDDDDE
jgi:hypothetical protein